MDCTIQLASSTTLIVFIAANNPVWVMKNISSATFMDAKV